MSRHSAGWLALVYVIACACTTDSTAPEKSLVGSSNATNSNGLEGPALPPTSGRALDAAASTPLSSGGNSTMSAASGAVSVAPAAVESSSPPSSGDVAPGSASTGASGVGSGPRSGEGGAVNLPEQVADSGGGEGSARGGSSGAGGVSTSGGIGAADGSGAAGGIGSGGSGMLVTVNYKPRLINTTDLGGDPDDQQSMVRQLVTSNEFDLEGLIVATGCWKKTQDSTVMLDTIVNAYGKVVANLELHADGYPSLQYLQSISVLGNTGYGMDAVGEGLDSDGSNLIIAAVDKDDPRPVWVTCWGGCNTIAQAIFKVQDTRSASELSAFLSKLRVYDVLGQDDSGAWLVKTFPELFFIRGTGVYGWAPSDAWIDENVQDHGALGAVYPDRMYDTEGDSPSFMYLYPNGLHNPEHVAQGGWGGRFNEAKQFGIRGMSPVTNEAQFDPYALYTDTLEGAEAIARWRPAYDNDFEARMDWTVSSHYADANHHPVAVVANDTTRNVLELTTEAGSVLTLDASSSSDPDADGLSYSWRFYAEPSSYAGAVTIEGATSEAATLTVPNDAAGESIHIVLELHDDGEPNLYAYRRVILSVR